MRKSKIYIALALCLTIAATMPLTGCGSNKKEAVAVEGRSNQDTRNNGEMRGMVKSVDTDKKQITISVMGHSRSMSGDEKGGQAPKDGQNQPPEKPDGKEGSRPSGDSQNQPPVRQEKESVTYTLDENITITDQNGKEINLADIKENDFVIFTVNDDKIITLQLSDDHPNGSGKNGSTSL
ncbi:MAG: hypothetical protein Q4E53_06320 [Eubacteriales bacterium]|nr:hypothetical protein [Eubacteriales bacterium]